MCWCITNPQKSQIETTNYNRDKRTLCVQIIKAFLTMGFPLLLATRASAATLYINRCKTIDRWVATLMKTGCARTASCLSETGHGLNPTVSNCALALPQNVHHYTQLYQTVPQLCPNVPYCTLTVPHCTPTVPNCTTPKTGGFGLAQCSGKNKVGKRRRRSPCLAFVIAMAGDDNVVDPPTQLICISDFYVNRQRRAIF